ncbi:DUF397 domain-containing protein [Streptomyces sp. N2-109]|uniref:DUF397 domain-containing protein n=1 Tax=Streptomyces gossypii TaxID=2883101 RepID=A0ABT2JNJ7_9ACTN|nr:DUF397 domain-containing protein [Streptomyces gossypii]MCT2589442.1 DUF397 domain-containing protein [Streptomyces gossypii]
MPRPISRTTARYWTAWSSAVLDRTVHVISSASLPSNSEGERRVHIRWRKSSFSEQPDGNCLELARQGGDIMMRESDDPNMIVKAAPETCRAFLAHVKAGAYGDLT